MSVKANVLQISLLIALIWSPLVSLINCALSLDSQVFVSVRPLKLDVKTQTIIRFKEAVLHIASGLSGLRLCPCTV